MIDYERTVCVQKVFSFDVYMLKSFFSLTYTHTDTSAFMPLWWKGFLPLFCLDSFYCPGRHNGSLSRSYECPLGHYCPSGTWSKHQYPCPAGSINPNTRMAKLQDCLPCPPGQTSRIIYCKWSWVPLRLSSWVRVKAGLESKVAKLIR